MTAAEPTDELREAIRDELGGWPIGSGYYQYTVGIDDAAEMADALLSGPLAPLLAKLRAMEELATTWEYRAVAYETLGDRDKATELRQRVSALRRALDAS